MKKCYLSVLLTVSAVLVLASPIVAMPRKQAPKPVVLTSKGKKLMAHYAAILKRLRGEISSALPHVDPGMVHPFMDAYKAEGLHRPYLTTDHAFIKGIAQCQSIGAPILSVVDRFLSSSRWDNKLAEASIISDATPKRLAAFAQKSPADERLINTLLSKPALMTQMQAADGARNGNYGLTMQIYTAIEKASPYAHSGILQRLALATALMQEPTLRWQKTYNPVARYMNYQSAYQKKLLDPAFPTLTTWQCRYVVDDPFSNKEISWFRKMYMNYEPYNIASEHYVNIVHTDVGYNREDLGCVAGSRAAKLIAGGGECGARAWIGRLAERAFGIPTWGVRQRGHAALSHWTRNGWITRFSAGWEWLWWHHRNGLNFILEAQARRHRNQFKKVLRAQWIAATLGEKKPDLMSFGAGGFWYAIANNEARAIIASGKSTYHAPSNAVLARKYGPTLMEKIEAAPVARSATHITVNSAGVITIPAACGQRQINGLHGIIISESDLGGMQITYHNGEPVKHRNIPMHYVINVPHSGTYKLVGQFVSVKPTEYLNLSVAPSRDPVTLTIPWTNGMWQMTSPVEIRLHQGKNTLTFQAGKYSGHPIFAITVRKWLLRPVN